MPAAPESSRGGAVGRDLSIYTPMPLARRTERTLEDIGYKPFHVYGFAYTAVSLAYSLTPFRCKHSRPKDSEVSPEPQLIHSDLAYHGQPDTLAYFLPYSPETTRAVGQAKELCNTEDEIWHFNIVVCMHGSLAGKTTHGKISPLQKSTKSESLTNFSVLPSPTLPTSRSSKVRVINVQRPSDR